MAELDEPADENKKKIEAKITIFFILFFFCSRITNHSLLIVYCYEPSSRLEP